MAEESLIEGEDENILYDLLVINEWPPETDTQVCHKLFFGKLFALFFIIIWFKIGSSREQSLAAKSHVTQTGWQLTANL